MAHIPKQFLQVSDPHQMKTADHKRIGPRLVETKRLMMLENLPWCQHTWRLCTSWSHILQPPPPLTFHNGGVWVFWPWAACSPHLVPAINPVLRTPGPDPCPGNLVSVDRLYCAQVSGPKTGLVTHLPITSTKVEAKSNNVCEMLCCNFSDIKVSCRSVTTLVTPPSCRDSWPAAAGCRLSVQLQARRSWASPRSHGRSVQGHRHSLSPCNSFPAPPRAFPSPTNWLPDRTHQKGGVWLIPVSCCLIMPFPCLVA